MHALIFIKPQCSPIAKNEVLIAESISPLAWYSIKSISFPETSRPVTNRKCILLTEMFFKLHWVRKRARPVCWRTRWWEEQTNIRCSSVFAKLVGHQGQDRNRCNPAKGHLLPSPALDSRKLARIPSCLWLLTYFFILKEVRGWIHGSECSTIKSLHLARAHWRRWTSKYRVVGGSLWREIVFLSLQI